MLNSIPTSHPSPLPSRTLFRSFVTIPIKFYDYIVMPDCSDGSMQQFKERVMATLGLSDSDGIVVTCRYAINSYGETARRLLRRALVSASNWVLQQSGMAALMKRRGLEATDTKGSTSGTGLLDATVTFADAAPLSTAASASSNCQQFVTAMGGSCDPTLVTANPRIVYSDVKEETSVEPKQYCQTQSTVNAAALARASQLSTSDVRTMGCTVNKIAAANPSVNSEPPAAVTNGSKKNGGLSTGGIIGICIGCVGGVVVLAVVGLTIKNRIDQSHTVNVGNARDAGSSKPGGRRWRTYSMQQRAEEATAGSRPVAGVSVYT